MKKKHETINGVNISVWDNKNFIDRYTIVFLDDIINGKVSYLTMNDYPFHPQGFCQHGEIEISAVQYKGRGGCFDKRIKFDDLPEDCQKAVLNDINNCN